MQRISFLVLRHLRNELNAQESEELQRWLAVSEENRRFFERCTDEEQLRQQLLKYGSIDTDAGWQRFAARHQVSHADELSSARVIKFRHRRWVAAAAVLLAIGAGAYLWQQPPPAPVAVQQPQEPIRPGSSKALLTLADGTVVPLDSAGSQVIRPGIVQRGGQLQYTGDNAAVSFNVLTTPRGGQFRLTLPDGTKVWLNAASSLRYPTAFTGADRTVEVSGEAYFEVAQKADKPFRAKVAGQALIEVLGTRFNVNAYPEESSIEATLLQGAVKVSAGTQATVLKPGEQAQVNASGHISVIKDADLQQVIAWKNELFYFRDADIRTIMRQLERWYDVEVEYAGEIPERRFRGEIQRALPLSDVLEGLKSTGIKFTIKGRTIIVQP